MSKGMRILITGVAGFMGSHLAESLIKEGMEVYGIDDLSGGYLENVPDECKFYETDLRCKKETAFMVESIKPEIVYHLAADATEGRSQFTPLECTERNYMAYLNLLIPCIKNGMKKMVLTSSMSVYGNQKPPFNEKMKRKPVDIYGISKSSMEHATEILSDVHNFKYTIVRPHNVYGPKQNMADPYRNVVAIWINSLLNNKHFYIYGDGEQKRAFSYISDVTPCMALAGLLDVCNGEIINVGPREEYTLNELAKVVMEEFLESPENLNRNLLPKYLPDRPKEVKEAYCTNDKAIELLNYRTTVNLREGIKEMIKWAKLGGPKTPRYLQNLELENEKTPETWSKKLI